MQRLPHSGHLPPQDGQHLSRRLRGAPALAPHLCCAPPTIGALCGKRRLPGILQKRLKLIGHDL
ncbi:MAG: hypothetical protein OIN66_18605 [Candidatus Methanoperedens sp.]|nr:hypothetical protein [Candidatus Methanoperedens sp.]